MQFYFIVCTIVVFIGYLFNNVRQLLKETFIELAGCYSKNEVLVLSLWNEIEKTYSHSSRHYHSLEHLKNLLQQLDRVKDKLNDWEITLFSLYYHDIIYNSLKSDNEEKSADLAVKRMRELSVPDAMIMDCKAQILATKSHKSSENSDTNYFTDADLSILGQSWEVYSNYSKNVRKEYAIYPDLVYKPGRKKVLAHFLEMERIFKTDFFFEKFEVQARKNMQEEFELL